MNIGRLILLILIGYLFSGVGPVLSQTRLPESAFEDWSAVVTETALSDGSVLFDYSARTFSGGTEGAMLAISFVPRFSCAPTVTLRRRADAGRAYDTATLVISVDSERMQFDGLIDKVGDHLLYGIAASSDMQDQLRKKIDVASRFVVETLLPEAVASNGEFPATDNADSIVFSLLGSQRSTSAAEAHCKAHKPLEFIPQ